MIEIKGRGTACGGGDKDKLTSYTKNDRRYEYAYNSDGMRTLKKVYEDGELVYTEIYVWDGDVLLGSRLEVVENNEPITVRYLYDESGELYGMDYNGSGYFAFIKNLQGDIVSIVPLNSESNVEVNMEYDAWGKPIIRRASSAAEGFLIAVMMLVTNVGYRGYFYDFETGLYYLRSRYYDPETGRFINADDTDYLGIDSSPISLNLFIYCENNPINSSDKSGYWSQVVTITVNFYNIYTYHPHCDIAYDGSTISYGSDNGKGTAKLIDKINGTQGYILYKEADRSYDADADCANFVSQCLFEGGLSKMTQKWYNKKVLGLFKISSKWGKANDLYKWLKEEKYIKRQIIVKNKKELSDCVKKYLYNKRWCIAAIFFDWTNDGKVDHAALSGQSTHEKNLYDLYYYAHSNMRNGKKTKYYPRYGNPYYSPVSNSFDGKCRVYICLLE